MAVILFSRKAAMRLRRTPSTPLIIVSRQGLGTADFPFLKLL
jgi:hypothetical protein